MTSNTVILTQPENDSVLNHEIPNDSSARLNYDVGEIEGLAIGPQGELVISFEDGGQVNITNFENFTEDGNLLYLSDGTLVDATILTSAPLNPIALNNVENAAGDSSIQTISKPDAGTIQELNVEEGVNYVCDFDPNNAALVETKDGQMILTFADGSQVVINNYSDVVAGQLPEELTVASTVTEDQELLTEVTDIDDLSEGEDEEVVAEEETESEEVVAIREQAEPEIDASQVANIEPAAGENLDAIAQALQDIEPAAGDTGAVTAGGNRFNSEAVDITFNAPNAIGPLGPTSLRYSAPEVQGEVFLEIGNPVPSMNPDILTLDETNLSNGAITGTGNINVDFGGDGNGGITPNGSFTFTCDFAGTELTSGGVTVDVTATPKGYVGTANGNPVFTFDIDNNGQYTYEQVAPFDHGITTSDNEEVCLNFGVVVSDTDGDTTNTTVQINVLDDAPLILSQTDQTVDESNTNAAGKTSANGQFFADAGQDVGATYGGTGVVNSSIPLTSNGAAITVSYDAATATYTGATATDTIFTVEMNSATGEYEFVLCGPLDHADGNNPDDNIAIEFGAFITDFDGDTATGSFTVNVKDDGPVIESGSNVIDETNGSSSVNGSVNVDFGYDGAGQVSGTNAINTSLTTLTSNGQPVTVTFDAATNTYTGATATSDIFTLVIDPATGDYTFNLIGALDHPDATDPNDSLVLDFGVIVQDNDGDTANSTISITVNDDGPSINSAQNVVDETDGNVTVNGNVAFDGGFDGVQSFSATDGFTSGGSQLGGTLTSGGVPVVVTFDATTGTYTGIAGAETIFTMTINNDGSYSFELQGTLDHADANNANDIINLDFPVQITDNDGDTAQNIVRIFVKDDVPTIGDSSGNVDETNLDDGALVYNDVLNTTFGADVSNISADGNTSSSTPLFSNGNPVTISQTGNTYTGTANGQTIFTLVVNANTAEYEYTQFFALDHPDSTDANDTLTIDFGVQIQSFDGDSDTGTITITVADDGPIANDDINGAEEGQAITGNVLPNDTLSQDAENTVTNVNFGGVDYAIPANGQTVVDADFGVLTINSDGSYTYTTDNNDPDGKDVFTYTLTDFDGDSDTAKLEITVTPDGQPVAVSKSLAVDETNLTPGPMIFDGDLDVDFGLDGAGQVVAKNEFTAGGSLKDGTFTSNDVPVLVTLDGNIYTGIAGDELIFTLQVNNEGTYTFQLFSHIDHADATDPNDAITLDFGIMAMDADGDGTAGNINILIYDDAPVAYDDGTTTLDESATVNGNVTNNDELSEDKPNNVVEVIFNGTSTAIAIGDAPVVINGNYGTLTISFDGTYSYTAKDDNPEGTDIFTYVLEDFDGDQDTAEIGFAVNPLNDLPQIIKPAAETVDETNLDNGDLTDTGTIQANFFGDGPGTIQPNNSFNASTPLTSGGVAVVVAQIGNSYVGTANGETIFTLEILNNGNYTYTQSGVLDHPDASNPNDAINLNFGVIASDKDGDSVSTTLTVKVLDDGPVAVNDGVRSLDESQTVSGNVTNNDELSEDTSNNVVEIRFNGNTTTVPTNGTNVTITGQYGVLKISSNGSYSYTANENNPEGTDIFTYVLEDFDGDQDTAEIGFAVNPLNDLPVIIKPDTEGVDETNLDDGPLTLDGTIEADFFGDGPGTIDPNGTFSASSGDLTSCGKDVNVTVDGNSYIGTRADGVVIFTLEIQDNGNYNFTQFDVIDHPDTTNPNDFVTLNFGVSANDKDGDTASTTLSIDVYDDGPTISNKARPIDESDADANGELSYSHKLNFDFGEDGAGSIGTNGTFQTKYQVGGNNQQLKSGGEDVTVTNTNTSYVGKTASGATVFTLVINPISGEYTYTQFQAIDHPDANDADDVIWLKFGVDITDKDGDQDDAFIIVDLHDDAPTARDDIKSSDTDKIQGNVTDNDDYGYDGAGCVLDVTFDGQTVKLNETGNTTIEGNYGTLVINTNGDYTYTANNQAGDQTIYNYNIDNPPGSAAAGDIKNVNTQYNDATKELTFSVTIEPSADGFTLALNDGPNPKGHGGEMALFYFDASNAGTPVVTAYNYNGQNIQTSWKDGSGQAGTQAPDQILSSLLNSNAFGSITSTTDSNGNKIFSFTVDASILQNHNPTYGNAADWTGAEFGEEVGIWLHPVNELETDYANGYLTQWDINSQSYYDTSFKDTMVTTIDGGKDNFTYTIKDADGDISSADLCVKATPVSIPNDVPTITKPGSETVDESNLDNGNLTDTGTITADFKGDGPGKIDPNGEFSNTGGALTSCDKAVNVTSNGSGYTGTRSDGVVVFTLAIKDSGDYTYTQFEALDHPNTNNPNDALTLTFGVKATDEDGDSVSTSLDVRVLDDGPEISSKARPIDESDAGTNGQLSYSHKLNFDFGEDGAGSIGTNGTFETKYQVGGNNQQLKSGGEDVIVTNTNNTYVGKTASGTDVFTLVINSTSGQYTYTQFQAIDHPDANDADDVIWMKFGVEITDKDGDTADAMIIVDLHDDGPIARNDNDTTNGETISGNVTDNDDYGYDGAGCVSKITFGGKSVDVPSTGTATITGTYGTLKIAADGSYTYNPKDQFGNGTVHDSFTYTLKDGDLDTVTAKLNIDVNLTSEPNDVPTIVKPDTETVDESNLDNGNLTDTGTIIADFKGDGPGKIDPNGEFSNTGGALTSCDKAVNVTSNGSGYTGTRSDGVVVFTLAIKDSGDYTYTQFEALDHPNTNNPNDALTLTFGVKATDEDGDSVSTSLDVRVLDDGPVASNDSKSGDTDGNITGNVTSNDNYGEDGAGRVVSVSFEGRDVNVASTGTTKITGDHGVLTISSTGSYSYAPTDKFGNGTVNDVFGYSIVDKDGDKDSAELTLKVSLSPEPNDVPTIVKPDTETVDESNLDNGNLTDTGTITADFKGDGPGKIDPNGEFSNTGGALTSCDKAVNVTSNGNGYTGTRSDGVVVFTLAIKDSGDYTYTQFEALDHPNTNNPNDALTLTFGVKATDEDGDSVSTSLDVRVLDDGPVASNDSKSGDTDGNITGNVTSNDNYGEDGAGRVVSVSFEGRDVNVASTGTTKITGDHGVLTISSTGSYSYAPTDKFGNGTVNDVFGYSIVDKDGDKDSAELTLKVSLSPEPNDVPTIVKPDTETVDESNLDNGNLTDTGTITADFKGDGPGKIDPNGEFSNTGGALTSCDKAVNVTSNGNGYTGTRSDGVVVFTLAIKDSGDYTYTQFEALDHPNTNNPNDALTLTFGVKATDEDGDSVSTSLDVRVLDDGPVASNDSKSGDTDGNITGNVTSNDNYGEDGAGRVVSVSFEGRDVNVASTGTTKITGDHGVLTISSTGSYSYAPTDKFGNGTVNDVFGYSIVDKDRDKDSAELTLKVSLSPEPLEAPEGKNDFCTLVLPYQPEFSSNLIDNDTFSNTGGRVKSIIVNGKTNNVSQTGTTVVAVAYGEIAVKANGDYTFTVTNPDNTPTTSQNFQVVITDSSGLTDVTTFQFNIVGSDLEGSNGKDTIYGSSADDVINGNAGGDWLYGEKGNDTISGGDGWDTVDGGQGNDTLYGNDGNDLISGRQGNDTIYGGNDNDDIYGDGGVDDTYVGNDKLYGQGGDDYIYGGRGTDTIDGGSGNDILYGGDGNDTILGGAGNDDIIGQKGNDTLTGNSGADTFWFLAINEGLDTIKDFNTSEDKLELSNVLTGYDAGEDINDFLFAVRSGGDTTLHANNRGNGKFSDATAIVTLENDNVSVNDLMNNGNIIL